MKYSAAVRCMTALAIVAAACTNCYAVTSSLTKHASAEDFQKGQTDGTVVGSDGTIRLGLASQQLWAAGQDDDIWAINRLVTSADGTIYAGTSPKGKILRFAAGKWTTTRSCRSANPAPGTFSVHPPSSLLTVLLQL